MFPNFHNRTCCEKYLKDNKQNNLLLVRKYAHIFVLGHYLSVLLSSQYFLGYSVGKLFALWNRLNISVDNIRAYFHPKWRLLFIYYIIIIRHNKLWIRTFTTYQVWKFPTKVFQMTTYGTDRGRLALISIC